MARIAKADVNKALDLAAKTIITAGGDDGRTSKADLKAALPALGKKQAALTEIFFKFIDNRDFRRGAQVTKNDVQRAVDYAKKTMIAKYDLTGDGLSKSEIAKMSLTGKRAVDLAKALKSAGGDSEPNKLNAAQLGKEIGKVASQANYMSESDYSPEFISVSFPAGHDLTDSNLFQAFKGAVASWYNDDLKASYGDDFNQAEHGVSEKQFSKDYTVEVYDRATVNEFLNNPGDESDETSDKAWKSIAKSMRENLTDVKYMKFGPKDEDGGLASDTGLYAYVVAGRTHDGKLAGVVYGSVET